MDRKSIAVLINPVAGRGKAARKIAEMRSIFSRQRIDCDWFTSSSKGDIEEAALDAARSGSTHLIVAGGDGSVHEAVNGIAQSGEMPTLSVIPVGTGNDFAKACAVTLKWRYAMVDLAQKIRRNQEPRLVDTGRMNNRYFANGAGIGFDAKVNQIARDIRWKIGDLVYLFAVIRGINSGVTTPNVRLKYDDKTYDGPITLANISNGPWLGGMFHVAPMADIGDGNLDLELVAPVAASRILRLLPNLMRGSHIGKPEVAAVEIECFDLRSESPLPSHLDGEVQPLQSEFSIRILKNSLCIL